MQGINGYIYSLLIISISCTVITIYSSGNKKISKYIQFLLSLIITAVLLMPFKSISEIIPEIDLKQSSLEVDTKYAEKCFLDNIVGQAVLNIEEDIKATVNERFGIVVAKVIAQCDYHDSDNIYVKDISIYFKKENKLLFSDIIKYISGLYDCSVCCYVEAVE